jgi:hypothetical protein
MHVLACMRAHKPLCHPQKDMRPSASNPNAIEIFCMRASTSAHARTNSPCAGGRVLTCTRRTGWVPRPHRARARELAGADARGRRADGRSLSRASSTHILLASTRKTEKKPPTPTHSPLSPRKRSDVLPSRRSKHSELTA